MDLGDCCLIHLRWQQFGLVLEVLVSPGTWSFLLVALQLVCWAASRDCQRSDISCWGGALHAVWGFDHGLIFVSRNCHDVSGFKPITVQVDQSSSTNAMIGVVLGEVQFHGEILHEVAQHIFANSNSIIPDTIILVDLKQIESFEYLCFFVPEWAVHFKIFGQWKKLFWHTCLFGLCHKSSTWGFSLALNRRNSFTRQLVYPGISYILPSLLGLVSVSLWFLSHSSSFWYRNRQPFLGSFAMSKVCFVIFLKFSLPLLAK